MTKPDSSDAGDAKGDVNTGRKAGRNDRGLGDKKKWPKYDEKDADTIKLFLSAYLESIEEAIRRARSLYEIAPEEPGVVGQLAYWEAGHKVVRWLLTRVDCRHRHLAIIEYIAKHGHAPE